MMPLLENLGWQAFFQDQISHETLAAYVPLRVIAVYKSLFMLSDGSTEFQGKLSGKFSFESGQTHHLPVAGDWVLAHQSGQGGAVIKKILDRKSQLTRRRPMDRNSLKFSFETQVIAANLDFIFVVMSLNHDFSASRLERALTLVWNSGATPVVLLSKSDLCPEYPAKVAQAEDVATGVDVHAICSLKHEGLDSILHYFHSGKTGCLIGSSGVGKSTLVNALCQTHLKTLTIREDDDKGRHATTTRRLFMLPKGGLLIDTPGLREFGLTGDAEGLAHTFEDIITLAKDCRFKDCSHITEPGCAVLTAVEEGQLEQTRLDHFLKLKKEAGYQESKHNPTKKQAIKSEQKQMGRLIKEVNKMRKNRYQ
ncbi:ribosome small subunit-dependent GTPase A [bacterium]|nr:ribosome small subunit-dependent GTPase A [bacterium]